MDFLANGEDGVTLGQAISISPNEVRSLCWPDATMELGGEISWENLTYNPQIWENVEARAQRTPEKV